MAQVIVERPDRRLKAQPSTRRRSRRGGTANLLYIPALALFAVFTVYPLIRGAALSFTNWDGYTPGQDFVGMDNYLRLLNDPTFHTVMLNTLIYGVGSTVIQQILGLGLAVALDRPSRFRSIARALIYLPVLVSPVIMGTMYYLLFQYNNGTFNDIMVALGQGRAAWLSDPGVATAIIVVVNSLQFTGISMIIYLAGLQSIPGELYEASSLDGATGWKQFTHVTVPLLQPAFAASIVLNLIGGLKLFDLIKVLTAGGPGYSTNSVSTLISVAYFDDQTAGYASAMGVVLFLLILVVSLAVNAVLNRRSVEA
ncbi:carbohydrate ABC transporter permease [Sinomonas sp. P47F7]|uniref:carbohydrate ABC transporter permease n=1 Tax=Sinomonas sp. P47F7 TaxID=3410987 RepID=UPI003BF53470